MNGKKNTEAYGKCSSLFKCYSNCFIIIFNYRSSVETYIFKYSLGRDCPVEINNTAMFYVCFLNEKHLQFLRQIFIMKFN